MNQLYGGVTTMFGKLIAKLKANPKKIVFTEGTDPRILECQRPSAGRYLADPPCWWATPMRVRAAAEEAGFNIRARRDRGSRDLSPHGGDGPEDGGAAQGARVTEEQVRGYLKKGNYFGTMLVKSGRGRRSAGRRHLPPPPTPCVPPCSSSRPSRATRSSPSCFIMVRPSATGGNEGPG